MVSVQPTVPMRYEWTVEDILAIDVEDWRRYELVDGALVVSPPTATPHEFAAEELRAAVREALPPELITIGPAGVEFDRRNYRMPDLAVVSRERLRERPTLLRPADLVLAVEIVSPGSVTTDRITKPAQYAAAGIRHFWRVELEPISLTAYDLVPGATTYRENGAWQEDETARINRPFALELQLARLSPDASY